MTLPCRTLPGVNSHQYLTRPQALRPLITILLVAISVRTAWAITAPHVDPFLQTSPLLGDAVSYDLIAQNILNGVGFTTQPPEPSAFWPPLYPFFLTGVYRALDHHLLAGRLVQALLGALVPLFAFLIASKVAGRNAALLTGFGLAIYPHLIYFGAWLTAEALFMALFSAALWTASLLSGEWRYINAALLGGLLGLCALTKPVALSFLPFLALWLFSAPRSVTLARRTSLAVLLSAAVLIVLSPWALRNYRLFGRYVLISTNGAYTFLGANNPDAWGGHDEGYPPLIPELNDVEMAEAYFAEAIDWIFSNPVAFLRLLPHKYLRLISPLSVASSREDYRMPGASLIYVFYSSYLLLAAIGIFVAIRHWRKVGFLCAPILGIVISTGLFYGDARYTLPAAPSLVIFVAIAIGKIKERVEDYRSNCDGRGHRLRSRA